MTKKPDELVDELRQKEVVVPASSLLVIGTGCLHIKGIAKEVASDSTVSEQSRLELNLLADAAEKLAELTGMLFPSKLREQLLEEEVEDA